jgi:hypothetical protein
MYIIVLRYTGVLPQIISCPTDPSHSKQSNRTLSILHKASLFNARTLLVVLLAVELRVVDERARRATHGDFSAGKERVDAFEGEAGWLGEEHLLALRGTERD